jgi:hypothetical protein
MAAKKTSKKNRKSSSTAKPQRLKLIKAHWKPLTAITACLLLLAGVYLYYSSQINTIAKQTTHYNNESRAYNQLRNIDDWFVVPGELVYDKLTKDGCGRDPSSWLGIYQVCSDTLVKVYKGSGNAEGNLRLSDKLITSKGWGYSIDEASKKRFEYFVTHREAGGHTYDWSDHLSMPSIDLNFFALDDPRGFQYDPAKEARDYMSIQTDIPLGADEYLYGIRVVTNYRE